MIYHISKRCFRKINSFYHNVANLNDAFNSIYEIERSLLRRKPTLERWSNYHMANTDKWYFAYTIDGDTITIVDACHAQNMHDNTPKSLNL